MWCTGLHIVTSPPPPLLPTQSPPPPPPPPPSQTSHVAYFIQASMAEQIKGDVQTCRRIVPALTWASLPLQGHFRVVTTLKHNANTRSKMTLKDNMNTPTHPHKHTCMHTRTYAYMHTHTHTHREKHITELPWSGQLTLQPDRPSHTHTVDPKKLVCSCWYCMTIGVMGDTCSMSWKHLSVIGLRWWMNTGTNQICDDVWMPASVKPVQKCMLQHSSNITMPSS